MLNILVELIITRITDRLKKGDDMYIEVNIALNGKHFFATSERSITNTDKYNDVLTVFRNKFPESEGYTISATQWDKIGKEIQV